ncbi:MAG TPA: sigma 54-interacting transcriptional regulator, partial [Kofleriaceae bacterium]|nr:sigma 54-interacting transcriptional regulator [Kofleriaceae bacterium]
RRTRCLYWPPRDRRWLVTEVQSKLLLDVWREACRHAEIGDSVRSIAPLIARLLPLDLVLILRLDAGARRLETVASVGFEGPAAQGRRELQAGEADRLAAWCRSGDVAHERTREPSWPLAELLPSGIEGDVLVAPLREGDGPPGILLLLARAPRGFDATHEDVARALREPVAVALDNDRRFAELARLREAVEADNRALLSRLAREDISDSIVGSEAGLRDVMEQVEKVAPTDAPVLILGETGSGKEVIARSIHARSRRGEGPVVRVNCGAIPPELVDSELFGHERGSFTGAVGTRKGWFERADGGTLFLDEIGELPLAAQVRLLRVVQDGMFERVGGTRALKVEVRLVAATHRDLGAMVRARQFREDLWYRINVFMIRLPPLRERLDDLGALADHFAQLAARRFGVAALRVTPADLELLRRYEWPGNVRELSAVIDRAAILGEGRRLDVERALGVRIEPARGSEAANDDEFPTLDAAIRAHIERALLRCHGRIEGPSGAARLLGLHPNTLRSKMNKLGVLWSQYRA